MSAPLPTPGFDFDTWSPGVGYAYRPQRGLRAVEAAACE